VALPAFAAASAIDRYLLAAGLTAANMQQRVCCCGSMLGQTDRQRRTDGQTDKWTADGRTPCRFIDFASHTMRPGGSVAEWLACWTQAQKALVQIAVATLSGNSLRQTVPTHCASVHQAPKLVAALLRVAGVTAGLAESNGSLPSGL